MNSKLIRFFYLFLAILFVVSLPFIILAFTDQIDNVDYGYALPQVVYQLIYSNLITNIVLKVALILLSLGIIFVSTTFLFKIKLEEDTVEEFKNHKLKNFIYTHFGIKHKNEIHIFLGYFLAILAFDSFLAHEIIKYQSMSIYQAYIVILPSIATVLLIARILSHYKFKIIETNIGNFIVLAYVTSFIFIILSSNEYPISQIFSWIDSPINNSQPMFIVLFSIIITTFAVTYLDWLIIKFGLKRSDENEEQNYRKKRCTKSNIFFITLIPVITIILLFILIPTYSDEQIRDYRETKFLKFFDGDILEYKDGINWTKYTDSNAGFTVEKPFWRWKFVPRDFPDVLPSGEISAVISVLDIELDKESKITTGVQRLSNTNFISLNNHFDQMVPVLESKHNMTFEVLDRFVSENGTIGYIQTVGKNEKFYKYYFTSARIHNEKLYTLNIDSDVPEKVVLYNTPEINFIFNSYKIFP